jgi:superfamily II DNA helicase RecQ
MDGENYIAYFASTGSGKSLSIFLPALARHFGLIITIVPMVALRQNLASRFKALGIWYADWDLEKQQGDVNVLLAMPEHISTRPFERFVQMTQSTGRLARIVVNECHYVLFTSSKFRPHLKRLREIVTKSTLITYLSATVLPS